MFLSYWQVQCLHALKAERLRRITLVQALVRGFLVRRRLGGRMTSGQQRALIGGFMNDVSSAGNRSAENVQAQADFDRHRFEREVWAGFLMHTVQCNFCDNSVRMFKDVERLKMDNGSSDHSVSHSFAYSFIHSPTHSQMNLPTGSLLTQLLTDHLTRSFTCSLIH